VELQTSADIPLTGEENELVGKLVKKGQVLARVDVTKQPEEINRLKLENAEADSRRKGIQGEIQSLDVIIKSQSSNTTLANTALTREEDLAKLGFLAKTAVENTIVHRNEQEAKLKGLQQQREGLIVEDRLAQAKIIANTSRILDLTKQLSRVESRLSPCTCYVLSATSSSGRIVFTLIDPKKQGYIEVALLKNQASSLIPGEQFSFIFNNETQKGKFSQISTNKKTRIGIPDALWDNPKYTIVQIQPDYPILLEENIKVLGQQVHVLWLNGWFRNLWNTIQMNSQRFIG
jgi:multidrug resistance efflux pump